MQENAIAIKTDNTPAAMIQMALSQGQSLEQLEKLLELQIRYEKNEARKSYHDAMARFKVSPPRIDKDRHVKYSLKTGGTTEYHHATLANVTEKINSALSAQGLSASWVTDQDGDKIKVTCKITHNLGHSEETSLSAAADASGSKNPIQAIGSTVSYLQRYTLLALTGLATFDMDDDGNSAAGGPEYIDEKQLGQIRDMMLSTEANSEKFLALFSAESDEKILAKDFGKAMTALKAKQKAMEKKERESGGNDK